MEENQIELIDFLNIIWKRKWLIIIPTFILVLAVGVISFLLPAKWEVDSIILPSKFLVQTLGGQFEEVLVAEPKQIAEQINKATYNRLIASDLNIDIRSFPKLIAENLEETKLVRISIKEREIEKAKAILQTLFKRIRDEMDAKAKVEIKEIESGIKSIEIEKLRVEEEIKTLKKKLSIVDKRKKEIEKEMDNITERTKLLEEDQRMNLRKENRSESESLGMLLYSNVIQQTLMYHNSLNETLSNKTIEEENYKLTIENLEKRIEQLKIDISNLNERKGRIDFTRLVKKPTSSVSPVFPKKKLNVVIAGVLGLVLLTIFAFFQEYIKNQKRKDKS